MKTEEPQDTPQDVHNRCAKTLKINRLSNIFDYWNRSRLAKELGWSAAKLDRSILGKRTVSGDDHEQINILLKDLYIGHLKELGFNVSESGTAVEA